MDTVSTLNMLGLSLPGPAYLFGAIVFGLVGMVAFRRARIHGLPRSRWIGLALMLYPYAVQQTWLLYAVGVALCAALWWDARANA